eukprot:XP_001707129.1 Hypothetical protein GL50803_31922 [Giardia lamblia ATCC 50803]
MGHVWVHPGQWAVIGAITGSRPSVAFSIASGKEA